MAELFRENGIDYDKVNYFTDKLTVEKLQSLSDKLGISPFAMLRTKESKFKELALNEQTPGEKVFDAIVENPGLLNRPIVEVGGRAVIARPIERALELIRASK